MAVFLRGDTQWLIESAVTAILITLGVLFLLDQWRGDYLSFHNTWPVLLLVIGAIKLGEATASNEGHVTQ